MKKISRMSGILAAVAWLLSVGITHADTIIGPGNIATAGNDNAAPMIVVDLNASQSLAAGDWTANLFSYQFSAGEIAPNNSGTVTPLLLTSSGGNYTPIAIGDAVPFAGTVAFGDHPFGGAGSFTLASGTTVYAGIYWIRTAGFDGGDVMPIGMANSGSSLVRYQGANAPVVGTPISGGTGAILGRTYDFSVTVTAIPEPGSLTLLGLLGGALFLRRKLRRA